jgi:hypothetical protein
MLLAGRYRLDRPIGLAGWVRSGRPMTLSWAGIWRFKCNSSIQPATRLLSNGFSGKRRMRPGCSIPTS